jgi:zinc protease
MLLSHVKKAFAFLVFLQCAFPVTAAEELTSKPYTEIRTIAGVTEYRLPNGLTVLLMQDKSHPSTYVNVTYRVGSRHEGVGEAGMAHLLEHITFRGNRRLGELDAELNKLSVRNNGSTSTDRTDYIESFKADDAILARVLEVEAARMTDVQLRPEDFEKEKPIVLNEMGLRNVPTQTTLKQTLTQGVFRSHPYGHPVIGYTKDIEAVSLPTLRAFYQRFYRPDNALLMVAGSFDKDKALAAIVQSFGSIKRPEQPIPAIETVEPMQKAQRVVTVHTPETGFAFGYRIPGAAHPDTAALNILAAYLSSPGRSALASFSGFNLSKTFSKVTPIFPASSREPYLLGYTVTLPTVKSNDPSALSDFNDIEQKLTKGVDAASFSIFPDAYAKTTAKSFAKYLEATLANPERALREFGEGFGAGDWRIPFKLLQDYAKVDNDELGRVAFKYLQPSNRTVVRGMTDPKLKSVEFREDSPGGAFSFIDKPINIEPVNDVESYFKDFNPKSFVATKATFNWTAQNLDKSTRRMSLPSGIMVSALDRSVVDRAAESDKVTFMIKLRWGRAEDMTSYSGWRALDNLMRMSGAGEYSSLNMRQLRNGLSADISVMSSSQTANVVVTVPKENLIRALALVKTMLVDVNFAEFGFDNIKVENVNQWRVASAKPSPESERERLHRNAALGVTLGHPEYRRSPKEMLELWEGMRETDVTNFYSRFWSANDMSIAFVGSIPDTTLRAVEELFGKWKKPSAPDYVRYVSSHKPEAADRYISNGPATGSAIVTMRQQFPLNRRSEEYGALLVGVRILAAAGTSGARLSDRLRAEEAISYHVGNDLSIPLYGDNASVTIRATGAPKEALRLEKEMKEQIDRLLADGVTEAEVNAVRKQIINDRGQRFSEDASLASALLQQFDDRMNFVNTQAVDEDPIEKVTAEQVKQVMRKLLKPDAWIVKIIGAASGTK